VLAVDRTPGLFARLRADRSLVPAMITEAIRWQTPLSHMRRTALTDVELHGQRIARGDKVVMWYASGNRDEAMFMDADSFHIDRPQAARHLAFGHGIHRCIGSRFAEMALQIIWEEILNRFLAVEVVEEPTRIASTFNSGFERMHVRLHPSK
jgi:cytochrome P450